MISETCRIQRYMFHNRLRGTGVRNDGNRMIMICETTVTRYDHRQTDTKLTFRTRCHSSLALVHT